VLQLNETAIPIPLPQVGQGVGEDVGMEIDLHDFKFQISD
jgi:hypothetical protein